MRGEIMGDKQRAARVAWATITLSEAGQRPVSLDQLATQVGLPAAETARLLQLTWQERIDLRDGIIRLDATPAGPRRYRVDVGGRPVGAGKGCSVDMYLLALALGRPIHAEATWPATGAPITVDITPNGVERIDPPTAVVAIVNAEARRLVDRLEATPLSHAKDVTAPDGDHTVGGWRQPAALPPRSGR
jgi:Alkylmercury lyase